MYLKTLLCALMVLPAFGGVAFAADQLSDAQMDMMTAGQVIPSVNCPNCATQTVSSTSTTTNGVTTMTMGASSTGTTSSGSGGGSSGGGGNGGSGGGNGGAAGGGQSGPTVGQLPPDVAAAISNGSVSNVSFFNR